MASNSDGNGVHHTYSKSRGYLRWEAWAGCTDSASWIFCEKVRWAISWDGPIAGTRSVGAVQERVRSTTG